MSTVRFFSEPPAAVGVGTLENRCREESVNGRRGNRKGMWKVEGNEYAAVGCLIHSGAYEDISVTILGRLT